LKVEQFDGKVYGFEEHLDSNRTDGFLVLQKGEIIYEKYFSNMTESKRHNWFSVSKSLTGLTAAILAAEGKIDLQKSVLEYMPELKGTAWDGPTVQQVMDMEVNIKFDEVYMDPRSDAYKFSRVSRFVVNPKIKPEFDNVMDYFKSVKSGDNIKELFHYVSLNTEVIGMIIKKVTGKQPSEVMGEKIWSKMGAEQDGFVVRDPNGYEMVSAAINSTLRDAGRLGQMMLNDGYFNGQQIVPKSVVETIEKGGSIEKFAQSKRGKQFKSFHYTNQWWHTDKEAYFAKGLFGQWIYVDPATESVIVKFTTADIPTSTEYDWVNNMNLMNEIVKHLGEK
ncbi:MAG: serine hydrolase domain-containing protein, partial [Chitinophagales bacterium]